MIRISHCDETPFDVADVPKYQRTFATPLKELPSFVSGILSLFPPTDAAVQIELIVFDPVALIEFLKTHGVVASEGELHEVCISASADRAAELLIATLSDWIDFWFLRHTDEFRIFADHDEYTTIYSNNLQTLADIFSSLTNKGFREIDSCLTE